jgi:hypothetical protein
LDLERRIDAQGVWAQPTGYARAKIKRGLIRDIRAIRGCLHPRNPTLTAQYAL